MKTIYLAEEAIEIATLLELAEAEPILLVGSNGREYVVAETDDFEREVGQLRTSHAFQQFLDARSAQNKTRTSLEDFAREIEAELAAEQQSNA